MSRKRQSLKHRAELYAAKHPIDFAYIDAQDLAHKLREVAAKQWRDGYLQARRDARKHACLS